MTHTLSTLPSNPSDQNLLDHDARQELLLKIALRERLLVLLNDPTTPINAILKLTRALQKMQEHPFKQKKAELDAKRQEQRDRQFAINEDRIALRHRVLDLREAEHQRKQKAAAAREAARQEKAARHAQRQAKPTNTTSTTKTASEIPQVEEPAKRVCDSVLEKGAVSREQNNQSILPTQKAA